MGCGMVRKVDELGRVVIPKEMRRVLNIKTGSSIEMVINDNNQIVLKKFSELSNIVMYAENLSDVIFDTFKVPCLISDDEKIIICKGVSKKEFVDRQLNLNLKNNGQDFFVVSKGENFIKDMDNLFDFVYVFPIICEGFESGFIFLLNNVEIEKNILSNVIMLKKFLTNLLKF